MCRVLFALVPGVRIASSTGARWLRPLVKENQQKIEDKSVYVKGFRMPFGEMVTFIFKWTMASIPTAIFLAILFLIFTAFFA